uniref:Solute carrier family 15 member 1 n=1 Tax=Malurus cyaneus samueli TaxID=2593467 RepID=A0A8C5TYC3_9PASS
MDIPVAANEGSVILAARSLASRCSAFPVSIFFIIINEFCERFSYYGMKAVLTLYLIYFLRWDENVATIVYHSFAALCYLTPLLGAIIADSWLGKFKTILYLSIVYTAGQAILSVGSVSELTDHNRDGLPDNSALHIALSMVGLVLIAIGTGGIKPCVSAFGGDQFEDDQEEQRSTFFSLFYVAINSGSLLSTIITPNLRASECGIHTKQRCYPLAFGVPAILMAVALVVFIIGSKMYKKVKPQGNVLLQVCKCVGFAIKNRFRHRSKEFPKREHWLDWASEKYDKRLIAQTKMVLKVLFLYIPLPMFWALFDQQIVNPVLIIIMVPVVDYVVYPLVKKCKINFTPLKKMTVGMFFASMAFVAAALVQVQIDKTYPVFPAAGQAQIRVINLGLVQGEVHFQPQLHTVELFRNEEVSKDRRKEGLDTCSEASVNSHCCVSAHIVCCPLMPTTYFDYGLFHQILDNVTSKPKEGNNLVRFINNLGYTVNVTMDDMDFGVLPHLSVSNYSIVPTGSISYCTGLSKKFGFGSAYTISLDKVIYFEDVAPNTVHMAWQIPQYFLLTCGEVMFSVTGVEFSYSQAPSNMKSVLQAGWLLTVAVGNIIVLIVAGASQLSKQWAEYVLFASLLLVVCVIFAIMAYFYTYIDPNEIEAQFSKEEKEEDKKDQDDDEKEDDSRM